MQSTHFYHASQNENSLFEKFIFFHSETPAKFSLSLEVPIFKHILMLQILFTGVLNPQS